MKKISLLIYVSFVCLITHAQQSSPFVCALDNFLAIAREKTPGYDLQTLEREKSHQTLRTNSTNILTIPVVVHVVWNTTADSISAAQVASQMAILNTDFMRLNPDTANTPSAFVPVSANPKIQFCLAQIDPQGNPTNGITYTKTIKTSFALVSGDTSIWHTSKGGYNGWDPNNYLNIWVADISPAGGIGFWPGAVFPGHREGVVINNTFFGTMGSAVAPYNLGRTATHEIGHFLNLHHLWGDAGSNSSCTGTDYCGDTPTQVTASQNCPTFPKVDACTNAAPGLAFMNFMDYPQDACRNMFTNDQVTRMRACLEGGPRSSLLSSTACSVVSGVRAISEINPISLFPNPATNTVHVANIPMKSKVKLFDAIGKLVLETEAENMMEIDVTAYSEGVYMLIIENTSHRTVHKLMIAK
ncbi:MAG: T9SS type A sorting domain-containing protein [Bacteroidetes bacterium]|nr:T9SS type A sorting domain-containing protein [Bacteroidota bacterium]